MPAPGGVKAAKDSRETPPSVHGATRADGQVRPPRPRPRPHTRPPPRTLRHCVCNVARIRFDPLPNAKERHLHSSATVYAEHEGLSHYEGQTVRKSASR